MLKIVLVDDCEAELNTLETMLDGYIKSRNIDYSISRFLSPNEFMKSLSFPNKEERNDIYFLDIMMPNINGIELAKKIKENDLDAKIIFISSSSDYAVKSYEARAFYYILKPLKLEQFAKVMDLTIKETTNNAKDFVNIHTKSGQACIYKKDIVYVELKNRRSIYVLKDKKIESAYLATSFIKANSQLLTAPPFCFCACGASLIINLGFIDSVEKDGRVTLHTNNSSFIHVPRRSVNNLRSAWINYCMEVN